MFIGVWGVKVGDKKLLQYKYLFGSGAFFSLFLCH